MTRPRLDEGSEREAYPPLPEAEDFMYQHEETGITGYIDAQQVEWGFFKNNPRLHKVHGVYNEAQMRAYVDADRASRAALSTGRPGGEWLPIESAPKSRDCGGGRIEGVYLLGFCPDPDVCNLESAVCVVWWEPLMNKGRGMWYGEGGFETRPTHWMPLPPAPAAKPQGDSNA